MFDEIMARRQMQISKMWQFTLLMLTSLVLLVMPHTLTSKLQFTFAQVFSLPLSISRTVMLSSQQKPGNYAASRKESQYQNHIAYLEEKFRAEHKKVEQLTGLRSRIPMESAKFVLAGVIKARLDGSRRELTINQGQVDGIANGQFVLGDNSIIGTVTNVSNSVAQVKLISDTKCHIVVKIEGLEDRRLLMTGNGNNSAKIPLLEIKHKVKKGKWVYARRKAGLLDVAMVVGKISHCKRSDESPSLWDITVTPACDIENLDNVAVIVMDSQ
ncbi:MAG: rod shape-determining protein MreC [Planctomycetota bacterium]|jgi:rod shape-determining protein MreC